MMDTEKIHKYLQDQDLWLEVQYWAGLMHDHDHQYEIAEEIVAAINHYKANKSDHFCCPKCGCNKMTGDGSKAWCLNEKCDFVDTNC